MKRLLPILTAALVLVPSIAQAGSIALTPDDLIPVHLFPPKNCEPGCVYSAFSLTNDGSLELLYTSEVGKADKGTLGASYSTTYANTPSDPADATISWLIGSPFAVCPACYLAVKDGNNFPSYYFYDLASWNGTDTLRLTGFWPGSGAISHVSIWGQDFDTPPPTPVPEPATGLLLTLALVGAAAYRRRQAARR